MTQEQLNTELEKARRAGYCWSVPTRRIKHIFWEQREREELIEWHKNIVDSLYKMKEARAKEKQRGQ